MTPIWVCGADQASAVVCNCRRREGACFEIPAEAHLAPDVYYHPFTYRDFSTIDCEDSGLAA